MTIETLLIYAAVAAGGWLVRHLGIGAPPLPTVAATSGAATPTAAHPIFTQIAQDVRLVLAMLASQQTAPTAPSAPIKPPG